jgi:hypothetical protein
MEIVGIYSDGSVIPNTDYTILPHDFDKPGLGTVFFEYQGLTTSYTVDVRDPARERAPKPYLTMGATPLEDGGVYEMPDGTEITVNVDMPGATNVRMVWANNGYWPAVTAMGDRGDRTAWLLGLTTVNGTTSGTLKLLALNDPLQLQWVKDEMAKSGTNNSLRDQLTLAPSATGMVKIRVIVSADGYADSFTYSVTFIEPAAP